MRDIVKYRKRLERHRIKRKMRQRVLARMKHKIRMRGNGGRFSGPVDKPVSIAAAFLGMMAARMMRSQRGGDK